LHLFYICRGDNISTMTKELNASPYQALG
jgi:hypothetical protein